MKGQIKSCKYNMDAACVELKFTDGSMIAMFNQKARTALVEKNTCLIQ